MAPKELVTEDNDMLVTVKTKSTWPALDQLLGSCGSNLSYVQKDHVTLVQKENIQSYWSS